MLPCPTGDEAADECTLRLLPIFRFHRLHRPPVHVGARLRERVDELLNGGARLSERAEHERCQSALFPSSTPAVLAAAALAKRAAAATAAATATAAMTSGGALPPRRTRPPSGSAPSLPTRTVPTASSDGDLPPDAAGGELAPEETEPGRLIGVESREAAVAGLLFRRVF